MIGAFILAILLFAFTQPLLGILKKEFPFLKVGLLRNLYIYHVVFFIIYYIYSLSNGSDSRAYFRNLDLYRQWFDAFTTGTKFIHFTSYPFVNYLGFNYEMMMILFAWFGYLGFVYFYIFFIENNRVPVKLGGYDLLTVLMFLPNMHFWTVSLGKGSLIFMGLGLFAYGMKKPQSRLISLLLGCFIVFFVRPHVFLFLGAGAVIGYFTGREKVPLYQKILVYASFIGAIVLFYGQILAVANLNEADVVGSFDQFAAKRAGGLSAAGSGVNINNYPLILKLFTFWFRPLFVDSPGILGLFVSVENLLYVVLFFKIWDRDFFKFFSRSSSMVKMSMFIFITASIALSFVMANLGIAMRQKSMVMYFLFFVIFSFLSQKEQLRRAKILRRRELQLKQNEYSVE